MKTTIRARGLALCAAPALLLLVAACSSTSENAERWRTSGRGANTDFDASADKAPEPGTLLSMAHICAAQGRDTECEALLTRLLDGTPDWLPAYTELSALYLRHDLPDSAEMVLKRGLVAAPDDPVLRNDLGMCHLLRHRYEAALAEFAHAASVPPLDARYRANMAVALAMLGRDGEALALWEQIVPQEEAQANLALVQQARDHESAQG